ncbi:MAG TPA: long-chain fatty acid--CoA ligase [Acidimicrobiales bacterium]|nr:long-chain fatty acid--CoA ligase [Acidimicrobiales bacterium]
MSYGSRPWLGLYDEGMPADIEVGHRSGLEMFRAAVDAGAHRPCVHYFGTTLDLAEVDRMSDALACGLLDGGLQRGDRVGLYLQNVPQFLVSMLATWKAGGIMVSLNPMLKARELEYHLNDSGARVLITLESLRRDVAAGVVPATKVESVITTSELDFVGDATLPPVLAGSERIGPGGATDLMALVDRHRGERPPAVDLSPSDVAFLTYTSGTTGQPKGAMNTHGNVVFNSEAYRRWMSLEPSDVVLGVAPLFHITGLIAHLTVGLLVPMPIVLGYRFDPAVVLGLIERYRATFTVGSITVFIALMNDPSVGERDLSSLTKAYSGGAPIAPTVVEAFERQVGAYIHNIYGLTETTSPSHAVPMTRRAPVDPTSGALSVGVPIYNTVVRVVGDDGTELPPGEVGELVTSGPQVVAGYWEKPDETAHALPGGELHTGDVGFMDEDGWFYVVDRKKDMIIAAGYKVWPREVEDVLYEHPAVREAAVVGVPDEYRGETVKAFVSLKPGQTVDEGELVAFCRERLAAYKYPRQVELVDELPKTVTGKILRRELRQPTSSAGEAQDASGR